MSVTGKALFAIERNLDSELTLDTVAASCSVSRFHLCHAFGETTGMSIMEYIRRRRLTEAARNLAKGADSIIQVAMNSGYKSHEAFSRAFKSQFGSTPEATRKRQSVDSAGVLDALAVRESSTSQLKTPLIVEEGKLLFVGRAEHVPFDRRQDIAGQWGRFMSGTYHEIEHVDASPPVGVVAKFAEDGIEYLCAAMVTSFGSAPNGCSKLTVPSATYAVFKHEAHVAKIGETYRAIWDDWFPASGHVPADAPALERHGEKFDPRTGMGGVGIWIPLSS
jgi:AraC family transcriptional regulator